MPAKRGVAEASGAVNQMVVHLADNNGDTKQFRIGMMSMKTAGRVQAWLKNQDCPVGLGKAKNAVVGLSDDVARGIIEAGLAEERMWPPQLMINALGAIAAIGSITGGSEELLLRILEQAEPNLTEKKLMEYVENIDIELSEKIIMCAMNIRPEAQISRSRTDVVILDPDGVERLTRGIVAALGVEVPKENVENAVVNAQLLMSSFGTVIRIGLVSDKPAVPKSETPTRNR